MRRSHRQVVAFAKRTFAKAHPNKTWRATNLERKTPRFVEILGTTRSGYVVRVWNKTHHRWNKGLKKMGEDRIVRLVDGVEAAQILGHDTDTGEE